MDALTITITEASDQPGYMFDVYTCDAEGVVEGMDSADGGLCTGEIEDALEMAAIAAKRILFDNRLRAA